MTRFLAAVLLAALASLPADARARVYPREVDLHRSSDLDAASLTPPLLLSGVACNAAAADRTFATHSEDGVGWAVGIFQVDFTHNAATAVSATPSASLNGQSTWASIPACDATTDGVCTLTGTGIYTREVTGSENFIFRVDFLGATDVKLVISCTAGGASDTFDLYGRVSTQ